MIDHLNNFNPYCGWSLYPGRKFGSRQEFFNQETQVHIASEAANEPLPPKSCLSHARTPLSTPISTYQLTDGVMGSFLSVRSLSEEVRISQKDVGPNIDKLEELFTKKSVNDDVGFKQVQSLDTDIDFKNQTAII